MDWVGVWDLAHTNESHPNESNSRKRPRSDQDEEPVNLVEDYLRRSLELFKDLSEENKILKRENEQLKQGQDFRAKQGIKTSSHYRIERKSQELMSRLESWTHASCHFGVLDQLSLQTLKQKPFERISGYLSDVWAGNLSIAKLEKMKVTMLDLIVAMVANVLYSHIVIQPLNLCTKGFRDAFPIPLLEGMRNKNDKAIRAWQAACLKAYNDNDCWKPYYRNIGEKEQSIQDYVNRVCDHIMGILTPIGKEYSRTQFDEEKARNSLMAIAKLACDLAKLLGVLNSGFQLLDQRWLRACKDPVHPGDDRVNIQGWRESDQSLDVRAVGSIVIVPGILKWGNDNGENWENWSVYTPAYISVYCKESVVPRPKAALRNVVQRQPECPRSMQVQLRGRSDEDLLTYGMP